MKSEALAERDAAQLIQMNTVDTLPRSASSSSTMNADKKDFAEKKELQDETFSNVFSTNDDFDFMSRNLDLTDLEILESRWKKLGSVRDGNETGTGFIRVRES